MAKIAIISIGLHGHVNPTLGITEELIRRGHDVVYLTSTPFALKVRATGARFRSFGDVLSATMGQMSSHSSPEMMQQRLAAYQVAMQEASAELQQVLQAELPGLILCDFILPEALLFAREMKIPAIKFFTTYALNDAFDLMQVFSDDSHRLRDSESKKFLARLKVPAASNLVFLPRSFQPFAESFDSTYHFVGPCLRRLETVVQDPEFSNSGKALILISLGTIFHDRPEFYKMCLEIFRNHEVQVVMAVGSETAAEALGPIPKHVTVQAHIPQLQLLSKANLFISHGGMNSTMESLSFGVPLVVIPQMAEQELTARRIAELELGTCIESKNLSREVLERAVDEVMKDERFRRNAGNMREEIERAGGTQRAVDLVEIAVR